MGNTALEVALARTTVTHAVRVPTQIARVGNTALEAALARPTATHAMRTPSAGKGSIPLWPGRR